MSDSVGACGSLSLRGNRNGDRKSLSHQGLLSFSPVMVNGVERHWFVATVPESAPVGTVRAAKEALKPAEVQVAQGRRGLRAGARNRRKNAAYRRQGEWFFLPVPDFG